MIFAGDISLEEKLKILADAAKYDVACTSSGVDRKGTEGELGNSVASGICHSFAADGRCISLLKVLYTNECIFDCKYCVNRASNDVPRASFSPAELCTLTIEFYRRNYIEGLFISSGVMRSPDYTMEQMVETLRMLREEYHFNGYIHCKAIPGTSPYLIEEAGWLADRMSVNLELPTAEGLKNLAPCKTRKTILTPIRQIQLGIEESRAELGMMGGNYGAFYHTRKKLKSLPEDRASRLEIEAKRSTMVSAGAVTAPSEISAVDSTVLRTASRGGLRLHNRRNIGRGFAAAGQSTQMIIGATPENDFQLISVAEALYKQFDLKRVFYSAFINVNNDSNLPSTAGGPPLLREHRLYQADWLLRYYGFTASEILSEKQPNFNVFLDPKCNWAVGNLGIFPVEINKADYFALLRVPGIGPKSARRIISARQTATLGFNDLKKIGVVLKRAVYFITCAGRMMYGQIPMNEDFITRQLAGVERSLICEHFGETVTYKQLSLFDDVQFCKGV